MDLSRWNSWAGGIGTFVVSAIGLVLLAYQIWTTPRPIAANGGPPAVTLAASASQSERSPSMRVQAMQWLPVGLIVFGILGGGALHLLAARTMRGNITTSATEPVPTDWEMSTDVTGWQVLFNLRNKKWGPPRETGLMTCFVMDPNGIGRLATATISATLPYDAAMWFRYPQDFGAPAAVDGVYSVQWETRLLPLVQPRLLSEGTVSVKLTEPPPTLPPTVKEYKGDELLVEMERDALKGELQSAKNERDEMEQAWLICKRAFGVYRLVQFAERVKTNVNAHNLTAKDEDKWPEVQVTIRFVGYAASDLELVKQIESILRQYTNWNITRDGGNNPALSPSDEFKVIFESAAMGTFQEVAVAFNDGRLINAPIGARDHANRFDQGHLVIEVLPTVS